MRVSSGPALKPQQVKQSTSFLAKPGYAATFWPDIDMGHDGTMQPL
ncbi:MAG: hypothetical protein HKO68_20435 [Desulfobacterales bacterium]|nr:hypothetical protein [Desulfobacterales bacterium]